MLYRLRRARQLIACLTLALFLGAWGSAWADTCVHSQAKPADHCAQMDDGLPCVWAATCPDAERPELGKPAKAGLPAAICTGWRHYLVPVAAPVVRLAPSPHQPSEICPGALIAAAAVLRI